jgi:glutathione peroxidase
MGAGMAAGKETSAWDFVFPSIDDEGRLDLAALKGRVLLVVNTASFCGYTYQYEGLEKLHKDDAPRGLTVVGVPSQDFNQESADNKTVKTFCEATFGVQFPMAGIAHVRGTDAAPFYAWVREQRHWEPGWNFNKVLIGRDGQIAGTFGSGDEPLGTKLSQAIEAELAKG